MDGENIETQVEDESTGSNNEPSPEETDESPLLFDDALDEFIYNARSLQASYPITIKAVYKASKDSMESFHSYNESYKQVRQKVIDGHYNELSKDEKIEFHEYSSSNDRETKRLLVSMKAPVIISRSFVVSLVSQFDSLVGDLVRLTYQYKPDLLNSSNKPLLFADLLRFSSIEDARKDILDSEINKVLYKSRKEQIDYLAEKSKVDLFKYLPNWKNFVEVTERRNLYVHANGVVSQKYIAQCKEAGIEGAESLSVGDKLQVSSSYYSKAYEAVLETGIIIAILLWRALIPDEQEDVDEKINAAGYDMINVEEYVIASKIFEFASLPALSKDREESAALRMLVNQAQTYKWMDNQPKMKTILEKRAWHTLRDFYKIGERVLVDDFDSAALLMKNLVSANELSKDDVKSWPLFKRFRETEVFRDAFRDLYGHAYLTEQSDDMEKLSNSKPEDLN